MIDRFLNSMADDMGRFAARLVQILVVAVFFVLVYVLLAVMVF